MRAVFLLLLLAPLAGAVAYAGDNDAATMPLGDLAPGRYLEAALEYDVGFSRFGDEEHRDGEISFGAREGNVRIWVGLGNDNVVVRMYVSGEVVWEREIARQDCWYGCGASGAIEVKIIETCEGQLMVYVDGDHVRSFTADTTAAVTIFKDNDVKLIKQGQAYECGEDGDAIGYDPVETGSGVGWAAPAAAALLVAAAAATFLRS